MQSKTGFSLEKMNSFLSDDPQRSPQRWLIGSALFVVIFIIHLWSLMRLPAPFVDEAWATNRAWGFVQTGKVFGTQDMGVFDRLEGYWTLFPWFPTAIQSIGLRIAGAPELFPMRLTSLLFGMLLLVALYAIANRLGGFRQALLTVFLCSISVPFFYSTHLARFDILATTFGFVALALYVNNRAAERIWVAFLSGLCLMLGFENHPHAAVFGPPLVALFFLDYQFRMFLKPHFWGFAVGLGLGAFGYAALHILPYPQSYARFNEIAFSITHTPPLFTFDAQIIWLAFRDTGRVLLILYPILILLIVLAVGLMLKERTKNDQILLTIAATILLFYTLLIRNKSLYYAILFSPVIELILAHFLLRMLRINWQKWPSKLPQLAFYTVMGTITAAYMLLNLSILRMDVYHIYEEAQNRINELILPGETILGSQTYWFGLPDHIYYSWEGLVYYQRYAPDSTLEDALEAFQPDILIIDKNMAASISDIAGESSYSQHLRLSKSEMEAFLNRYAELIAEYENDIYGETRIYRINWQMAMP